MINRVLADYEESRTAIRISICIIELGHSWSRELEWKVVSVACVDVALVGALVF